MGRLLAVLELWPDSGCERHVDEIGVYRGVIAHLMNAEVIGPCGERSSWDRLAAVPRAHRQVRSRGVFKEQNDVWISGTSLGGERNVARSREVESLARRNDKGEEIKIPVRGDGTND